MTPRPARNLGITFIAALLAAALVAPALRGETDLDGTRTPSAIPAAATSRGSSGEQDSGSFLRGAPESGAGNGAGPRNLSATGATGSPALPQPGDRGPVSRDPRRAAQDRVRAPSGHLQPSQAPKRVLAATARLRTASQGSVPWTTRTGIATTYGPAFSERWVALPHGPGWRFRVCGPGGCRTLVSTDAGPDLAMQRLGRIVDLPVGAFEAVCGMPWTAGVCPVSVTIIGKST